jgi:hypothetical protein
MELNPEEVKAGQLWFIIAGGLAVLLCFFLFNVDHKLSTSKSELIRGEKLNELRMAQTSVAGGETDIRLTRDFLESNKPASDTDYNGEFHPRVDYSQRVGNTRPGQGEGHGDGHH